MTKFNTLQEILDAANGHQISVQMLINKRAYTNGEHQNFEMSDELNEEIICKTLEVLGGQTGRRFQWVTLCAIQPINIGD